MAQPQELQRRKHRRVSSIPDQHVDWRCSEQAIGLNIPADPAQDLATGSSTAHLVGHRCSGNEPDRRFRRKIEQIEQPSGRDGFHCRSSGRRHVIGGILPPG